MLIYDVIRNFDSVIDFIWNVSVSIKNMTYTLQESSKLGFIDFH